MKKRIAGSFFIMSSVFFLLLSIMEGQSQALQFNLDCVISGTVYGQNFSGGPTCGTPAPPTLFGTINLADNSDMVDMEVDLIGDVHKILQVYLNLDEAMISGNEIFDTTSTFGLDFKMNGQRPDGYYGHMDLKFPDSGSIRLEKYADTIKMMDPDMNLLNLDPEYFNVAEKYPGGIFAAVHIGRYGDSPGIAGRDSIWVGARSTAKVPEPGTFILLSGGIISFAIYGRKKLRK